MKRLSMNTLNSITFEEGCGKYLENCRQRNLREATINHYKQCRLHFCRRHLSYSVIKAFTYGASETEQAFSLSMSPASFSCNIPYWHRPFYK